MRVADDPGSPVPTSSLRSAVLASSDRGDRDTVMTSLLTGNELAGVIRGQIERRAGGRIRDLHVSSRGGRIVLRGRSRTHYAKQLAQQAALDVAEGPPDLTNRIVVG